MLLKEKKNKEKSNSKITFFQFTVVSKLRKSMKQTYEKSMKGKKLMSSFEKYENGVFSQNSPKRSTRKVRSLRIIDDRYS